MTSTCLTLPVSLTYAPAIVPAATSNTAVTVITSHHSHLRRGWDERRPGDPGGGSVGGFGNASINPLLT